MELGDRGIAGACHFDKGLRSDRLEGVGVDALQERVHRLPPRPEAVVAPGRCAARAARDRSLKRVRVQVGHGGDQGAGDSLALIRRFVCQILSDVHDQAVVIDVDRNIARPAFG
jgi:hypothetical protein